MSNHYASPHVPSPPTFIRVFMLLIPTGKISPLHYIRSDQHTLPKISTQSTMATEMDHTTTNSYLNIYVFALYFSCEVLLYTLYTLAPLIMKTALVADPPTQLCYLPSGISSSISSLQHYHNITNHYYVYPHPMISHPIYNPNRHHRSPTLLPTHPATYHSIPPTPPTPFGSLPSQQTTFGPPSLSLMI